MNRPLVTIRKVSQLLPIEGADEIELAVVDGWQLVVKKGEFKEGDTGVYFEIDSFLPVREEFEFLRPRCYKKMSDGAEGFRLKTIKLRGQISQGLFLPMSILPDNTFAKTYDIVDNPSADTITLDVTEALGVVKYEPPIPANLQGLVKGEFPSFLRKTDEERVQNLSGVLDTIMGDEFYVTEKLDGSSITIYVKNGVFGVCSRNLELLESEENTYWKVARLLDIESKLKSLDRNICIQGELIGEGIQGNPYELKGQTIKFFSVFDIDRYEYEPYPNSMHLITLLGLDFVPVLYESSKIPSSVADILEMSDGISELSNANREGLVWRRLHGKYFSFKSISNRWLLKNEE